MRRKITVIGSSPIAVTAALLLAQRDVADLVILGAGEGVPEDLAAAVAHYGASPQVIGGTWPDAAGSDVVVVAGMPPEAAREIAERCPHAVLVVATGDVLADVQALVSATRFQRARVLGIDADGPLGCAAAAERLADAVLFDRRREHRCAIRFNGERGASGVEIARVLVGADGATEIL